MYSFLKTRAVQQIRKGITIAVVVFLGIIGLTALTDEGTGVNEEALRTMPNDAFTYGEKLTFAVKYKFITAGYAVMSVGSSSTTVSNRPCYAIKYTMRTTNSFDKIFKVRDVYRTWVDVDGLFPWKFQQKVREGDYKKDFSANIDQKENIARTTKGTFKVPEYVQDVLSAFYYTRAYDLGSKRAGQSFTLKNFYDKKSHRLKVKVLGRETISVKAGKFKCIKVQPLFREGGLFKNEGTITIWMTDDARKIPVKVSTKVVIGSIDSELIKYSGVKGSIDAKVG